MEPIDFPQSNTTLVADECSDLPAHQHENGYVTCWKLTADDMFQVLQTGCVWLHLYRTAHPPVIVTVEGPFEKEKEDGPKLQPD